MLIRAFHVVCVFILRYLTVLLLWYSPHYTYPISYTAPIFDIDINIDFDSESLISIAKSRRKRNAKWNCSFGLVEGRRRRRPRKDCWLYLIYILYTKLFIYTESIIHAYLHTIYISILNYYIWIIISISICCDNFAFYSKQVYRLSNHTISLFSYRLNTVHIYIYIYIIYLSIYNGYNEHHLQGAATGHILSDCSFCFLCCCCTLDFTRNLIISTKLVYA